MTPNAVGTQLNLSNTIDYSSIIGLLLLIVQIIYIFYAFLIIKQVSLMTSGFETKNTDLFKKLSYIHFALAVFVFLMSVIIVLV